MTSVLQQPNPAPDAHLLHSSAIQKVCAVSARSGTTYELRNEHSIRRRRREATTDERKVDNSERSHHVCLKFWSIVFPYHRFPRVGQRVIKGTNVIAVIKRIQGQRPDMEKRHTQQRTYSNLNHTYKVTKANEQLGLH